MSGDTLQSGNNRQFAEIIQCVCNGEGVDEAIEALELNDTFRNGLLQLFRDEAIVRAYQRRNKLSVQGKKLFDGCDYFLNEQMIRVFTEGYKVDDNDKVHSRNPTVDMHTYRFKLNDTRVEITDVGGQRSELVKIVDFLRHWSFDCAEQTHNFILLVVSMSDYNTKHEDYEGTLLDECVEYTKLLMNNPVARNCGLLIFFNKKDRFKSKLSDLECREDIAFLQPYISPSKLSDYLTKGKFDERQMCDALAKRFAEVLKNIGGRERSAYCRYTCAIDSKIMEGIFSAFKDDLLSDSIFDAFP